MEITEIKSHNCKAKNIRLEKGEVLAYKNNIEAGYKFEQTVWGTDLYTPSTDWDSGKPNGANRNTPGVMENVIEHSNETELPTVPITGTSSNNSTKAKTKKKT